MTIFEFVTLFPFGNNIDICFLMRDIWKYEYRHKNYFLTMINASITLRPGPTIYFPLSYRASDPQASRLIASIQPNWRIKSGTSIIEILSIVPIFTSSYHVRQINDLVHSIFILSVISPKLLY